MQIHISIYLYAYIYTPAIVGHELAPIPIFLGIRILQFQSDTSATRTFEFDDVCLDPPYHFRGFQKVPVERRDADLSHGPEILKSQITTELTKPNDCRADL